MFTYSERLRSPTCVEFHAKVIGGYRLVRIYFDTSNPRFEAFNESTQSRSPAILSLTEILELIQRSRDLLSLPTPSPLQKKD